MTRYKIYKVNYLNDYENTCFGVLTRQQVVAKLKHILKLYSDDEYSSLNYFINPLKIKVGNFEYVAEKICG
jgi:hypothetical protein